MLKRLEKIAYDFMTYDSGKKNNNKTLPQPGYDNFL